MSQLIVGYPITKYLLIFLISCVLSYWLTPLFGSLAAKVGAIDTPGGRHLHQKPTPRGAGIAIFLSFYISTFIIFFGGTTFTGPIRGDFLVDLNWWYSSLIASSILVAAGYYDDVRTLKPSTKLLFQLLAAFVLFISGTQFEGMVGIHFPWGVDLIFTLIWFVIIINAFNLIDGYDGLATGIAIIAGLGIGGTLLFRHLTLETLVMTSFIGACCGFLRHNIYPAKVFLGDSGSMFLGLLLAALTLKTTSKGTALAAIWIPLMALGVPLFDTFLAIWRRVARKILTFFGHERGTNGIFIGDAEHLHHRLLEAGITPRNITAILYLANSVLVLGGITSLFLKDFWLAVFFALFLIGSFMSMRYVGQRELHESGRIIVHTFRNRETRLIASTLYIAIDLLTVLFSFLLIFALWPTLSEQELGKILYSFSPLFYIGVIIVVALSEPYRNLYAKRAISVSIEKGLLVTSWPLLLFSILVVNREGLVGIESLQLLLFATLFVVIINSRILPKVVEGVLREANILSDEATRSDQGDVSDT